MFWQSAPAIAQADAPEPALSEQSDADQFFASDAAAIEAWMQEFVASLTPHTGLVPLDGAEATLDVSDGYVFLDRKDARRVLEEAWGNPPDETVLGMIMPAGATPFDDEAWAATVTYLSDGYVSDKDAAKINYDKLLSDLKKDALASNKWRAENGYERIEIIGWAQNPTYDADTHKMYWAKELQFGDSPVRTLNYDVRVLGRRGVLVIGFVAGMSQLAAIEASAPGVLAMANFDPGSTYAEYVPGVDQKAAYGLVGLVAGAAIAKKTGLLAAILLFGKKFIVLIIAGFAAMFGAIKRFFSTKAD